MISVVNVRQTPPRPSPAMLASMLEQLKEPNWHHFMVDTSRLTRGEVRSVFASLHQEPPYEDQFNGGEVGNITGAGPKLGSAPQAPTKLGGRLSIEQVEVIPATEGSGHSNRRQIEALFAPFKT